MQDEFVKKLIREFIGRQKIGVLSTVAESGRPEAAVIEFGETDALELIFDTLVSARKYANLRKNNRVAFVIGWDEDITVQYEGEAYELAGEEKDKYKEIYFQKNPKVQKWEAVPEIRFFKVVPKWVRYSNLKVHPWEVYEIKF